MPKTLALSVRFGVLAAGFAICVISAYSNARDEGGLFSDWSVYVFMWSALPLAVLVVYAIGVVFTKNPAINYTSTLTLMIGYAAIYLHYATNGSTATRPNSAAHMHIVLVPMLLGMLTLPLLGLMIRSFVKAGLRIRRERNHDVKLDADAEEAR